MLNLILGNIGRLTGVEKGQNLMESFNEMIVNQHFHFCTKIFVLIKHLRTE